MSPSLSPNKVWWRFSWVSFPERRHRQHWWRRSGGLSGQRDLRRWRRGTPELSRRPHNERKMYFLLTFIFIIFLILVMTFVCSLSKGVDALLVQKTLTGMPKKDKRIYSARTKNWESSFITADIPADQTDRVCASQMRWSPRWEKEPLEECWSASTETGKQIRISQSELDL